MEPFLVSIPVVTRAYAIKAEYMRVKVGWYLGDTTQSIGYLAAGSIDVAVTYNVAAEDQAVASKIAVESKYGFRVSLRT
jgi:hypothetical protein